MLIRRVEDSLQNDKKLTLALSLIFQHVFPLSHGSIFAYKVFFRIKMKTHFSYSSAGTDLSVLVQNCIKDLLIKRF